MPFQEPATGQEPAPAPPQDPAKQQDPIPAQTPEMSSFGFSPDGSLFWGSQSPSNPEPASVELAIVQSRERIKEQVAAQQQKEAADQYQAEITASVDGWYGNHSMAIMGGVVGAERDLMEGIMPVAQGFAPHGMDYMSFLDPQIRQQAQQDVDEWAKTAQLDPKAFQDVSEGQGFPVMRIPQETLDGWEQLVPGAYMVPGTHKDATLGEYGVVIADEFGGLPLSYASQAQRDTVVSGIKKSKDVPERAKELYGTAMGTESQYRTRANRILKGESPKDVLGELPPVKDLADAAIGDWAETMTFGMVSSPGMKRDQRIRQYLGTKGEKRAGIAGGTAAFISPGSAPGAMFSLGRGTGKVAFKKLTKKVSEEGLKKFRYRIGAFVAQAEGAAAGGLLWEKMRPHTGVEEHAVDELTRYYMEEGLEEDEARAEATAEFSGQATMGAATVFHAVEYLSPPTGRLMKALASGARKGGSLAWLKGRQLLKKTATATPRKVFRQKLAAERFEAVVSGTGTGAATGVGLGTLDPAVRDAFTKWWDSDFQDEESWDILVDGMVIGGTIFGIHGGVGGLLGFHTQLKGRYQEKLGEARGKELDGHVELPGVPAEDIPSWATTEKIDKRTNKLWEKLYEVEELIDIQLRQDETYAGHKAEIDKSEKDSLVNWAREMKERIPNLWKEKREDVEDLQQDLAEVEGTLDKGETVPPVVVEAKKEAEKVLSEPATSVTPEIRQASEDAFVEISNKSALREIDGSLYRVLPPPPGESGSALAVVYKALGVPMEGENTFRIGLMRSSGFSTRKTFDPKNATLIKQVAEAMHRDAAKKDGHDADALLGPDSALTAAGKRKRLETFKAKAEAALEQIAKDLANLTPTEEAASKAWAEREADAEGRFMANVPVENGRPVIKEFVDADGEKWTEAEVLENVMFGLSGHSSVGPIRSLGEHPRDRDGSDPFGEYNRAMLFDALRAYEKKNGVDKSMSENLSAEDLPQVFVDPERDKQFTKKNLLGPVYDRYGEIIGDLHSVKQPQVPRDSQKDHDDRPINHPIKYVVGRDRNKDGLVTRLLNISEMHLSVGDIMSQGTKVDGYKLAGNIPGVKAPKLSAVEPPPAAKPQGEKERRTPTFETDYSLDFMEPGEGVELHAAEPPKKVFEYLSGALNHPGVEGLEAGQVAVVHDSRHVNDRFEFQEFFGTLFNPPESGEASAMSALHNAELEVRRILKIGPNDPLPMSMKQLKLRYPEAFKDAKSLLERRKADGETVQAADRKSVGELLGTLDQEKINSFLLDARRWNIFQLGKESGEVTKGLHELASTAEVETSVDVSAFVFSGKGKIPEGVFAYADNLGIPIYRVVRDGKGSFGPMKLEYTPPAKGEKVRPLPEAPNFSRETRAQMRAEQLKAHPRKKVGKASKKDRDKTVAKKASPKEAPVKSASKQAVTETKDVRIETEMVRPEDLNVSGERFQKERADVDDAENMVSSKREMFRDPWSQEEYAQDTILAIRDKNGELTVVAGHHRRARALGLHGSPDRAPSEIPVRVITGRKGSTPAKVEKFARSAALKTNTTGKKLTRMELLPVVKEMVEAGKSQAEIRKELGISAPETRKILDLSTMPEEVIQGIKDGWLDSNKVARLARSMHQNSGLWNGAAIQRYLAKNAKSIADQTATQFGDNVAQIEKRYLAEVVNQAQGVFPGMEKTEAEIANLAIEVGSKRSKLMQNLEVERREYERTLKKYADSTEERHRNNVSAAKKGLKEVDALLNKFDVEHGLAPKDGQETFFGADPAGFVNPIVDQLTPDMFAGAEVVVKTDRLSIKDSPEFSEKISELQAKSPEVEIAGIIGVNRDGELVVEGMAKGDATNVALNSRDLLDKAQAQGIEEIHGVFHTHPKGEELSMADRQAARHLEDTLGVKLYMHDGKDLVEVSAADIQTPLEQTITRIEGALKDTTEKLKTATGEDAVNLKARKAMMENDLLMIENAEGKAEEGNPYFDLEKKYQQTEYDRMEDVFLDAGEKSSKHLMGRVFGHLWSPKVSLQQKGYVGSHKDTKKARGLSLHLRMPKSLVAAKLYDKMRDAVSGIRKRMDRLQKVLYGRDNQGPLAQVKRNSRSAWRIAMALDGGTVREWNQTVDAVSKHGALKIDPAIDMLDALTPAERKVYDAVQPVLKRLKRELFAHINRKDIAFHTKNAKELEAKINVVKERMASMEYENAGIQAMQMGRAIKTLDQLQVSHGRAKMALDLYDRLVDPETGKTWGFDRYFHHIHAGTKTDGGAIWKAMAPMVRRHISKEVYLGALSRRTGKAGWSLDLHTMFDVYIPSVVHKLEMDGMLDVARESFHGKRRRARSLMDLGQPWHTYKEDQPISMAITFKDGQDQSSYFAVPGATHRNAEGVEVSVVLKDISSKKQITVFKSQADAAEAGMPDAPVMRDFLVRDGGLASMWETRKNWDWGDVDNTIDYTERWIKRSMGERKDYGRPWEIIRELSQRLTGMEYHMYIGSFYPKAAVTNLIFGNIQTAAEIGLEWTGKGHKAAAHLALHPTGRGDRKARHYFKILTEGGALLDSFVGHGDSGQRGIGPPQTAHDKLASGLRTASFSLFKGSEKFVRTTTYLGAYLKGEAAGLNRKDSHQYARDVITHTQFDMGIFAAPQIVEHPLGFALIMLRRFALNMGGLAVRGYQSAPKLALGALQKERFKRRAGREDKALEGRPEEAEALEQYLADQGFMTKADRKKKIEQFSDNLSARNINDAARLARLSVLGMAVTELYKELFGRDPRMQYASVVGELPFVGDAYWMATENAVGKQFMRMPLPGITGPFEPAPIPGKLLGAGFTAWMDHMNGNSYAWGDALRKNRAMWASRTGKDVYNLWAAESVGNEGRVLIRDGQQAQYETTYGQLVGNLFLTGTSTKLQTQWEAGQYAYADTQIATRRRKVYNRLLLSSNPADIEKALVMGAEKGYGFSYSRYQRGMIMKETTVAVRRILTGADKSDRVRIAARYMPTYSENEKMYAMWILGMHEPKWWLAPNGTPNVNPEALQMLADAFKQRDENKKK